MYLRTRKSPLNFGSRPVPDLGLEVKTGFLVAEVGALRTLSLRMLNLVFWSFCEAEIIGIIVLLSMTFSTVSVIINCNIHYYLYCKMLINFFLIREETRAAECTWSRLVGDTDVESSSGAAVKLIRAFEACSGNQLGGSSSSSGLYGDVIDFRRDQRSLLTTCRSPLAVLIVSYRVHLRVKGHQVSAS